MTGFQRSCRDDSHVHRNDQKKIKYLFSLCLLWEDVYYWGQGWGVGITQWRNYKCIVNNVNKTHIKVHNIELILYSAPCLLFFKKAYWSFSANSSNF